jgi:spore cortex formation protein SpoVR/YcgB (stage V sporulation)
MNRLHETGLITDGSFLEFLHSHTSVLKQPEFDSHYYNGINPYALGFAIFEDIKRICEEPTSEDKEWFPHLVGRNWLEEWHFAMANFRDESFIRQYLSPHLIRKWHMFVINDDWTKNFLQVENIHNERGYKKVRTALANQYSSGYRTPDIQVWDVNLQGNRHLQLRHAVHNHRPLDKDTSEVMKHLLRLWGYGVVLESIDADTGRILNTYRVEAS